MSILFLIIFSKNRYRVNKKIFKDYKYRDLSCKHQREQDEMGKAEHRISMLKKWQRRTSA